MTTRIKQKPGLNRHCHQANQRTHNNRNSALLSFLDSSNDNRFLLILDESRDRAVRPNCAPFQSPQFADANCGSISVSSRRDPTKKRQAASRFRKTPLRVIALVTGLRELLPTTATATTFTEVAFAAAAGATTPATTAESSATTAAAEVTAGTFLTGTGFIDGERTSVVSSFAVKVSNGFVGFDLECPSGRTRIRGTCP